MSEQPVAAICRQCGELLELEDGEVPFDHARAEADADGNAVAVQCGPIDGLYTSHFATCPDAEQPVGETYLDGNGDMCAEFYIPEDMKVGQKLYTAPASAQAAGKTT